MAKNQTQLERLCGFLKCTLLARTKGEYLKSISLKTSSLSIVICCNFLGSKNGAVALMAHIDFLNIKLDPVAIIQLSSFGPEYLECNKFSFQTA